MIAPILRRLREPSPYADVQIDLTHLIFRKLLPTAILGAVGMIVTSSLMALHYHDLREVLITALIAITGISRVALIVRFIKQRDPELTELKASQWQFRYGASTILYSSSMAVSTIYNFAYHDAAAQGLCVIGTFSLCSALGARLGTRPWLAQLCGLIMLVTLGGCILASPIGLVRVGAGVMAFFAVTHCESVQHKFETVVEQLRLKRQLRSLADHDAMTGLANRRQFEDSLAVACQHQSRFAVLFIDLDRFKRVNDLHGHKAGDLLLRQVAERLRASTRATDLVARLGGDEFAILHGQQATESSAEALAARVVETIAAPFSIHGVQVHIGASVGIRMAEHEADPDRLLSDADEALYKVKEAGGGSLCFA